MGRARQDVIKVMFRAIFLIVLIIQLDTDMDWSWWLIFTPFWIMSFCICCGSYQSFAEAQGALAEKDPGLFSGNDGDEENANMNASGYGAMGASHVSHEEKEELKAQLLQAGYRMITSCCSQAFVLAIVCLFVGKLQGAVYSSIWIISPLLGIACFILLCLGCTIFCITDVSADEVDHAASSPSTRSFGPDYSPPNVAGDTDTVKSAPKSTWDPEKGEIWVDPNPPSANLTQTVTSSTIIPMPPAADGSDPSGTPSSQRGITYTEANHTEVPPTSEHQSSAIDELD